MSAMNNPKITTKGVVRLAVYVISAVVGIGSVIALHLGQSDMGTLLATISGSVAAIAGGTATLNLEKAPDQVPEMITTKEIAPAFFEIITAVGEYRAAQSSDSDTTRTTLPVVPMEDTSRHSAGISLNELRSRIGE